MDYCLWSAQKMFIFLTAVDKLCPQVNTDAAIIEQVSHKPHVDLVKHFHNSKTLKMPLLNISAP